MDSGQHMIIGRRGGGGLDIHNQMGGRWVTGFREMDLVADPLHRALCAIAGLWVIRGSDELRGRRYIFDLAPTERAMDLYVLFGPDASEGLDRGNLPQPGLLDSRVNRLEQPLPIRSNDRCERLTCSIGLGHLVVFDPMSIAVIPFWRR